jgi:hypothetical protein
LTADPAAQLEVLASLQKPTKDINLGPKPGVRVRSGITVLQQKVEDRVGVQAEDDEGEIGVHPDSSDLEIL